MSDVTSGHGRRWLKAAAWILIACGCAHLLGHVKSAKDLSQPLPVDADDATRKLFAAADAMKEAPIGGALLDSSLLGVLQGMSLFFSLGLVAFGVMVLRTLRSSEEPAVARTLSRVVAGFCVLTLVVSVLFFPIPPTAFFVAATVCSVAAVTRR